MNQPHIKHRLGTLVPSSNSTQEPEFISMLPASVSLHVARLPLSNVDPDSTIKIVAELEKEAKKLADADVDLVLLAATAPSTRMGKGYDAQLVERIQQACGKPATTAATAMLCAMVAYNIKKVVIAAPWSTATNVWVKAFLEDHGVEVLQHKALEVTRNNDIGRMPAQTAYDLGVQTDLPQADAVFLACGNWWTASIVADLEAKLKKPVLTTNNMALWASLQMMGVEEKVAGFGRLLAEMPPLTHHEKATV